MLRLKLQRLASTVAVSSLMAAGLTLVGAKPVRAEFKSQEAEFEKGEVEMEYRGAYLGGA
jgi:hypothetical protein